MTIEAGEIVVWVLVFLRRALFSRDSLFAGKMIPVRIRTAFGLLLAILINPYSANLELATHFAGAILLAMNEVCIGLPLALTVRMVFFAVDLQNP